MNKTKNPEIVIYTQPGCEWSAIALEEFKKSGISFKEIDITKDSAAEQELVRLTGGERITPVIVDGELVTIGYNGMG